MEAHRFATMGSLGSAADPAGRRIATGPNHLLLRSGWIDGCGIRGLGLR